MPGPPDVVQSPTRVNFIAPVCCTPSDVKNQPELGESEVILGNPALTLIAYTQ